MPRDDTEVDGAGQCREIHNWGQSTVDGPIFQPTALQRILSSTRWGRRLRSRAPMTLLALAIFGGVAGQCQVPHGAEGDADDTIGTAAEDNPDQPTVCTVVRIIDGDTVDCAESTRNSRLLLVDAPERDQGSYGRASTAALAELLPIGTRARVEYDVSPLDQYQRHLVYLYLPDGRMVNEEMARLGYVVLAIYPPNVRHVDRIRAAADDARRSNRGLWSGNGFDCIPRDYRAGRCR